MAVTERESRRGLASGAHTLLEPAMEDIMDLAFLLSVIALICGVLMLVAGRWSKFPLAAVAIICLAIVQSGLLSRLR